MNRRKKEADQHKGWNISISGVFIAMVMGIVLISVVAATLIFVQIYRNAMEQSAVTSSSQSCEQIQDCLPFRGSCVCSTRLEKRFAPEMTDAGRISHRMF